MMTAYKNLDLVLGDEGVKIFVNTVGTVGNVSEEFKELMDFINNPGMLGHNSKLVSDLSEAIESARNSDEWRHDYMTWAQMQNELIEEGRTQGIKEEVFTSVFERDYSAERGAQKLNISIDKFDSQYAEWKKENGK